MTLKAGIHHHPVRNVFAVLGGMLIAALSLVPIARWLQRRWEVLDWMTIQGERGQEDGADLD